MTAPGPEPSWKTAYHEAGHAVAFIAVGVPLLYVKVNRGGHCGRTEPVAHVKDEYPVAASLDAGVPAAAGFAAAVRWLREIGAWTPEAEAEEQTGSLPDRGGMPAAAWSLACLWADELLAEHWPAVVEVAELLTEHRWVSGARIRAIVGRHRTRLGRLTPTY